MKIILKRISLFGALALAAILLMTQMEFVMMASNYDGSITVDVAFRSGTKVEVMNQRIQTLEDALLSDENFESVTLDLSGNTASFTAYSVDNCDRSSEAAVEEYTPASAACRIWMCLSPPAAPWT